MKDNKQPLLSICIPTWNRWYIIWKAIDSVVKQKEFKEWEIELIISDNASTDDTKLIIEQFKKNYSDIKYFVNDTNIGGMRNILKSYSLWTWKYLWCLWSDDYLLDWCLEKTLKIIKLYSPDIIIHRNGPIKRCNKLQDNHFIKDDNIYEFLSQKDYFDFIWNQFSFDKNSFDMLESQITWISWYVILSKHFQESKNKIITEKWEDFFQKFNFIQSMLVHSLEVKRPIILFNDSYVEQNVNPDRSYQKKMKASSDWIWKKQNLNYTFYKESQLLCKYLINEYSLSHNSCKFFKCFVRFWKLLYIANIPFFRKVKGILSLETRRKLWWFFAKFG